MFVTISKEARIAFIKGQRERAHQNKSLWVSRKIEAQGHIAFESKFIAQCDQQIKELENGGAK